MTVSGHISPDARLMLTSSGRFYVYEDADFDNTLNSSIHN